MRLIEDLAIQLEADTLCKSVEPRNEGWLSVVFVKQFACIFVISTFIGCHRPMLLCTGTLTRATLAYFTTCSNKNVLKKIISWIFC